MTTTHANQVNIPSIQKFMETSPKYRTVWTMLARRSRGRTDTTYRRTRRLMLEAGLEGWTSKECADFFKTLERAGAGHVVMGKAGPRFVWKFHLQAVAQAVLGQPVQAPQAIRRPARPRVELPRIPVSPDLAEPAEDVAPTAQLTQVPAASSPSEVVVIRRGGTEFEMDLSRLSPDGCRKLTDLLVNLKG